MYLNAINSLLVDTVQFTIPDYSAHAFTYACLHEPVSITDRSFKVKPKGYFSPNYTTDCKKQVLLDVLTMSYIEKLTKETVPIKTLSQNIAHMY